MAYPLQKVEKFVHKNGSPTLFPAKEKKEE